MANHEQLMMLLEKHLDDFEKAATALAEIIDPVCHGMRDAEIKLKASLYQRIEYLGDVAKELSRQSNVQTPLLADGIIKSMENMGLDDISVGGYKYTPSSKTYVNVTSDNKPLAIDWLKGLSNEGRELVREDFNANSFSAFIKGMQERGENPPSFVNVYDKPTLSVRKAR